MSSAIPIPSSRGRISASQSRERQHRAGRNIHENAVIKGVIVRQILGSAPILVLLNRPISLPSLLSCSASHPCKAH